MKKYNNFRFIYVENLTATQKKFVVNVRCMILCILLAIINKKEI